MHPVSLLAHSPIHHHRVLCAHVGTYSPSFCPASLPFPYTRTLCVQAADAVVHMIAFQQTFQGSPTYHHQQQHRASSTPAPSSPTHALIGGNASRSARSRASRLNHGGSGRFSGIAHAQPQAHARGSIRDLITDQTPPFTNSNSQYSLSATTSHHPSSPSNTIESTQPPTHATVTSTTPMASISPQSSRSPSRPFQTPAPSPPAKQRSLPQTQPLPQPQDEPPLQAQMPPQPQPQPDLSPSPEAQYKRFQKMAANRHSDCGGTGLIRPFDTPTVTPRSSFKNEKFSSGCSSSSSSSDAAGGSARVRGSRRMTGTSGHVRRFSVGIDIHNTHRPPKITFTQATQNIHRSVQPARTACYSLTTSAQHTITDGYHSRILTHTHMSRTHIRTCKAWTVCRRGHGRSAKNRICARCSRLPTSSTSTLSTWYRYWYWYISCFVAVPIAITVLLCYCVLCGQHHQPDDGHATTAVSWAFFAICTYVPLPSLSLSLCVFVCVYVRLLNLASR